MKNHKMNSRQTDRKNRSGLSAIILSALLVVCVSGLLTAIALMPDFEPPQTADASDAEGAEKETDADREADPVWMATYDDLVAYLQERGFIGEDFNLLSEGVATEAQEYDEVELYWWDVDDLAEGSDEYEAWHTMQDEGYILLYGQYIFVPEMNGPFGMYIHEGDYTGDVQALRDAFAAFPEDVD